jgi:RND family efflux transporter MFP subunit
MKSRAKILLPLLVLLMGLGAAAGLILTRPKLERTEVVARVPLVRVIRVKHSKLALTVKSQGTVRPRVESSLVAQVAGRIDWVSPGFAEGGFFMRNQDLVRIEDRDFRLAVSQAEAQVAQAMVQVQREQAEADLAEEEWADLGQGEPSALAMREPQLAEAKARVQAAEATLEKTKLDLERTRIRASFDGRIQSTLVDLGQYVARGTSLARIYSTDAAEVRLPVAKDQLAYLDLGAGLNLRGANGSGPAVVLSGTIGDTTYSWPGRIVRTGSEFDAKTRMLPLFARVDDPLGKASEAAGAPLPIGMFVDAEIEGKRLHRAIVVPREALRSGGQVLVVDADSRLRFRDVQIFRVNRDIAVLTSGLSDGEFVCTSAVDIAIEGMKVRTFEESGLPRTDPEDEEPL